MTSRGQRRVLAVGALLGGAGVILGAFGAHALAATLSARQAGWWQTAVQYQMWHALAVLMVAALDVRRRSLIASLFGFGTLVFSGTLYLMALGLPRWLGAITPIGGLSMIAGWLLLASSARRPGDSPRE